MTASTDTNRTADSDADSSTVPSRGMRLAALAGATYRRIFANSPAAPLLSRPNPVRRTGFDLDVLVDEITPESDDVVSLQLRSRDGLPLPHWTPGAHLDLFLPSGMQRQYSLCGDPADRLAYRIAVRRIDDGLGGSREIHDTLRGGEAITVRGPRNAFPLIEAEAYLFLAGGIGITPILPMVRSCAERGLPWRLVYFGRSRASMPFLGELERFGHNVDIRSDDECGPPEIPSVLQSAPAGTAVYLCGPPGLMTGARSALRAVNPAASLHTERFSPLPVSGGQPFQLRLHRRGITVDVGADETALAAIRRVFPGVAYSCQQGFCGTCQVRVLSGEVDHRDQLLSESDREESMLVCVSRSAGGPLVLDL